MTSLFENALEKFGIDYKTNRRSIILRYCPSCGRSKNSVWMFRPDEGTGRTGGTCWVCGKKFSSFTYIRDCGHDADEVRKALEIGKLSPDLDPETWGLPDFDAKPETVLKEKDAELKKRQIPNEYIRLKDWQDHPASKYAIGRGVCGPLQEQIFIDPLSNSVAFPVYAQDILVGFQRRFVDPNAYIKVKTDGDLPKSRSFIKFGNPENPICVVEGPFDAVAAAWYGFYGVCTMGASVSRTQVQELAMMAVQQDMNNPKIFIGFDPDEAGEIGSRTIARLLDAYGIKFMRILPAVAKEDFNSILVKQSGLEFKADTPLLEVSNLLVKIPNWNWDLPMMPEFEALKNQTFSIDVKEAKKYRKQDPTITNDYTWADFKADTSNKAKNKQKFLNELKAKDPQKYEEAMKREKERAEKRMIRLKMEGLLDD